MSSGDPPAARRLTRVFEWREHPSGGSSLLSVSSLSFWNSRQRRQHLYTPPLPSELVQFRTEFHSTSKTVSPGGASSFPIKSYRILSWEKRNHAAPLHNPQGSGSKIPCSLSPQDVELLHDFMNDPTSQHVIREVSCAALRRKVAAHAVGL